jgi:general secretion pathway protein N
MCIVLVTAPARLLAASAPAGALGLMLPAEQVVLQGFSGSIWSGSVDSAAVALADGYFQLGSVQWDLSPWSLLMLSPRADVEARWGRQTLLADVSYSPGGKLRLRDTSVNVPARLIRQWLPVQLQGSLNLLTGDLSLRDLRPEAGSGRLVWKDARWIGVNSSQDLGDYVLEFEVHGEQQLAGKLSTLSGPLQATGEVALDLVQQQYSVNAELLSETAISSELGQALELVAEPIESGYRVELSGKF